MNPPVLPSQTHHLTARRCLVIAPHYDDEVLGCGGLVSQLGAAGTHVAVMFVSDGAGAPGDAAGGVEYGRRRREESGAACALLGVSERIDLGLPDGALALPQHVTAAADAIEAHLRRVLSPDMASPALDLILLPSPLEISSDHRAACAAVHEAMQRLRATHADAIRRLDVLLYEVNHSSYPDLLVDVSAQVALLEAAMACYASQQARHDYLAAALGHRRFRTLTLAPGVTHAEGYRRLSGWDFATRSLAQLVAHVGRTGDGGYVLRSTLAPVSDSASASASARDNGAPLVSVIVRTRDRPRLVREALDSLAAGQYRRVEIVLVNDGGVSPSIPDGYPFTVVRVEHERPRGRAAAAQAGIEAASGEYISFLDDDDLVAPEHLSTLVETAKATGARIVYSDAAVGVYQLQGSGSTGDEIGWRCVERELPYGRDFDRERLLVDNYIPLNTLLIERALFDRAGSFDTSLEIFEDWDMLIRLAALAPFQRIARVTCEYRQFRGAATQQDAGPGQALGEHGWRRPDFVDAKARVLAKHGGQLDPRTLARIIIGLRAEVADGEQRSRRLAEDMRSESANLRGALDAVNTELRRVYGEEARLTGAIRDIHARIAAEAVARADAEAAAAASAELAQTTEPVEIETAIATVTATPAPLPLALPLPVPMRTLAATPIRKASVLLVSWNGREHLETCLDALNSLDTPGLPWDCWVLDNGSQDGTVDWLRARHPSVRIVASPVNLGFCAAYNRLAAAADGDLLVFLNNDTRPTQEWLGQMIEAMATAAPDVAGAAGLIVDWEGEHLDFGRGAMTFDGHAFQVDTGRPVNSIALPSTGEEQLFACGANMVVRRASFLAAGGFDERFFAYYEDVDLGWRLWSGGERIISAPRAVVRHRSASTSDTLGRYNRGFLFERNAFLMAYTNYEDALWEKMMPAVMLTLVSRTITFLTSNNPRGETLAWNPFGPPAPTPVPAPVPEPVVAAAAGVASAAIGRWFTRRANGGNGAPVAAAQEEHPVVSDPLTIAQTRALAWVLRHMDAAAEHRHIVQARRRRSDAEIFAAFPLHLVPTYAGDDALFQSAGFQAWLPEDPKLIFRSLDEMMARK